MEVERNRNRNFFLAPTMRVYVCDVWVYVRVYVCECTHNERMATLAHTTQTHTYQDRVQDCWKRVLFVTKLEEHPLVNHTHLHFSFEVN